MVLPSDSLYVDSSTVNRTWIGVRMRGLTSVPPPLTTGLVMPWKLYHSSTRVQRAGRWLVDTCVASSVTTVAVGVPAGWLRK